MAKYAYAPLSIVSTNNTIRCQENLLLAGGIFFWLLRT